MSRIYFIRDERGERRLSDDDLPLRLGGGTDVDVIIPGIDHDGAVGVIALSDGHAYVAPLEAAPESPHIYHNHDALSESAWLKSGDRIEIADAVVTWTVKGDQVFVEASARDAGHKAAAAPPPAPPASPPPEREQAPVAPAAATTATPHPGLRRTLFGALAVLAAAAVYVAVAAPVTIEIVPEPDESSLSGFPTPLPVWGRHLALPGDYTLRATKTGYRPLEETVEVRFGKRTEVDAVMQELPGVITVEVDPDMPYRLFVDDGEATATADGTWEVERGTRRLRLEAERYLPEEAELEVTGFGQAQTVAFSPRPAWADVRIETAPEGAEIVIDGAARGTTPADLEILQGRPTIVLNLPAFKPHTLSPQITAGEPLSLTGIELVPADGKLQVTSEPADAVVSLDENFAGTTPGVVTVTPNVEHRLRVSKAGYRPDARTITLAPEEDRELTITLSPAYGVVFLAASPADATLSIDGKAAGKATQRLRLTTRAHTLEIRKTGYVPERVTVTPEEGVAKNIDVTLKTLAEAKEAATPSKLQSAGGQAMQLFKPEGTFKMGASRREAGRRANESARTIELSRPFYLAEKEVTNREFRRFKSSHASGSANNARLDGDNQPVVNVDWNDAARYCNWLSRRDGLPAAYEEAGENMAAVVPATTGYRMPTEAEWAYGARVHGRKESARYSWNGVFPPKSPVGNFADSRIADTLADVVPDYDDAHRGTAPVGSYPVEPSGLYDMAGNVAEWTNDFYAVYPGQEIRVVRDPAGPTAGDHRVVRGSSWRHGSITELRASYRDYSRAGRNDLGFRVARYAN